MKNRRIKQTIGFLAGILVGFYISTFLRKWMFSLSQRSSCINIPEYLDPVMLKIGDSGDEFIFIAVVVEKNFDNAQAIYNTWVKNVPGQVVFFVSENNEALANLPLVIIENLKTNSLEFYIHIYNYIYKYAGSFQYYMITTADTYVQAQNLRTVIKAATNHWTAQTYSKNSRFHTESLNLLCISGETIVISHTVAQLFYPVMNDCLSKWGLYDLIESMNIKRCLQESIGTQCLKTNTVQNLRFSISGMDVYSILPREEQRYRDAAIIYPVTDGGSMYYLYFYEKNLQIKRKEIEMIETQREMNIFVQNEGLINISAKDLPRLHYPLEGIFFNPLDSDFSIQTRHNNQLATFGNFQLETFGNYEILENGKNYLWNFMPMDNAHRFKKDSPDFFSLHDVLKYVNNFILDNVKRKHLETAVQPTNGVPYFYFRQSPYHGMQFITEMNFEGVKHKRPIYVQIPYGPLWVRETPAKISRENSIILFEDVQKQQYVEDSESEVIQSTVPGEIQNEKEIVNMIVALNQRLKTLERFMGDYEREVLLRNESVSLTVSLYGPEEIEREIAYAVIMRVKARYPEALIEILQGSKENSKSKALTLAASSYFFQQDILFFIDVDMTFKAEVFDKIRWFTIQGNQVYYPSIFSEYHPDLSRGEAVGSPYDHFKLNEPYGFWRNFGWGMVSIYLSDLINVGGFDTSIIGWGDEDIDLAEKVLKSRALHIQRSPDPDLVHVYHHKSCRSTVTRLRRPSCISSTYNVFSSPSVLTSYIKLNPDIYTFAKQKRDKSKNKKTPKKRYQRKVNRPIRRPYRKVRRVHQ